MKKSLVSLCTIVLLAFATSAQAGPITFATVADYDNNAVQTTGQFRDVLNGSRVSQGGHLVNGSPVGAHTALNFTGSDNNAANAGVITVYDTNPGDLAPTLFSGNISLSADILFDKFNNAKGAGLMALFNEGAGSQGLSLFLWDAGNSDGLRMNMVSQVGTTRPGAALQTTALGSGIPEDQWFRLMMGVQFTSATTFTVTGQVFGHIDPTDPNSALALQVGSTLVYNGALSGSLFDPYEIGLVARGDSATVDTSVTNFWASSIDENQLAAVPEPGSMILLATGLLGLAAHRRFRR